MNRRLVVTTLLGAALFATACGSDDESSDASATGVTIEGAWARTSPMMVDNGAAYMSITSAEDDRLLSAAVDTAVAAEAQIHETVMAETEMSETTGTSGEMTETTMGGEVAMEMREIEALDLPAGEAVLLAPGGYHIMLLGLAEPLELDQTFTITLTFEDAGEQDVTVVVAEDAP